MRHKIALVDDREDNILDFQREIDEYFEIQVIDLNIYNTVESIVKEILRNNVDAVVIDHGLSEVNPKIHFNGVELMNEIYNVKPKFPVFILTAYMEQAEDYIDDVNKVYIKSSFYDDSSLLKHKIEKQIETYNKLIKDAEERVIKLNQKECLSSQDEDMLMELDEFLEKSLAAKFKIPKSSKILANSHRLDRLISITEQMLKEVRKND